jgi:hypothetical protein
MPFGQLERCGKISLVGIQGEEARAARERVRTIRARVLRTLEHSAHPADQHADRAEAAGEPDQAGMERETARKLRAEIERMSRSPPASGH